MKVSFDDVRQRLFDDFKGYQVNKDGDLYIHRPSDLFCWKTALTLTEVKAHAELWLRQNALQSVFEPLVPKEPKVGKA